MTGLSPSVIRAWERRYGFVAPARSSGKYRLYGEHEVDLLRAAKRLVDAGHAIGEVARMDHTTLMGAAEQHAAALPAAVDGAAGASTIARALSDAVAAAKRFDTVAFDAAVGAAAAVLTPLELCRSFYLTLLTRIGDAWERGELPVAAEHFGSSLVRARLVALLDRWPRSSGQPRVVCGCPPGERHEGALLAFAVHAAATGWDVVYLGGDVPVDDLIRAVDSTGARLLALSLTVWLDETVLKELRDALAERRRRGPFPPVIVGGAGTREVADRLLQAGLQPVMDVAEAMQLVARMRSS